MARCYYKRSAIHNLVVTQCDPAASGINEGLIIPREIMEVAGLVPFEHIIVTSIDGDNWRNRLHSFAIPGESNEVEARGSLAYFLNVGSVVCIITKTELDIDLLLTSERDNIFPIIDIGFNSKTTHGNDITQLKIFLESVSKNTIADEVPPAVNRFRTRHLPTMLLTNLILGLEVNNTHTDCLHGSAEIPTDILTTSGMKRYQWVHVMNATLGGVAETYVVPTKKGIVMTTGAMARFAPIGSRANVACFGWHKDCEGPKILSISNNKTITEISDGLGDE